MPRLKMEQIKSFLDSSIAFIGVVAAVIAVLSWYAGKRLDSEKAIEEEKLKTRVAEANAEAETAKKEAAKANESISKTDLKANELELQLQTQIERGNFIKLELEAQKEKTANAEKELLTIKNSISPRTISQNNAVKLVNDLSILEHKKIWVAYEFGADEPSHYASEIISIFSKAGWNVEMQMSSHGNVPVGLNVGGLNEDLSTMQKLKATFQDVGINFNIIKSNRLTIYVGNK